MKVTGKSEITRTSSESAASEQRPHNRFSDVLEERRKQGSAEKRAAVGEGWDGEQPTHEKKQAEGEGLVTDYLPDAVLGFAPLPPAAPIRDLAFVAPQQDTVAAAVPDRVIVSLVQEIVVHAPPAGAASVDIQFNSRTLEGLHVRIQQTGASVEVRLSTASEPVARLLAANADSLAQALVRQGYVAPVVSVQNATAATGFSGTESRHSGEDRGSRGKQEKGGSQKRR